jgi:exodeoxyribonuclease-5
MWSQEQEEALTAVKSWIARPNKQVFRLFGYAGTGKTTLAKELALGTRSVFAAYTGKAAHVLEKKGCYGASTIHRLIYHPKDKSKLRLRQLEAELLRAPTEKLRKEIEEERKNVARPAFTLNQEADIKFSSLIIIDECSMVDAKVGEDLLSFGVPVLVLGDPAQLPPVKGCGFFTGQKPDILLTEIHRQTEESPVLRLATLVREDNTLEVGNYGSSSVIECGAKVGKYAIECDQIIAGTNRTRISLNKSMRKMLKRKGPLPEVGDRVVCLRNNHEEGLLNGSLWSVTDVLAADDDLCIMTVENEDGRQVTVDTPSDAFMGRPIDYFNREVELFDYGYALTCHKAQGSQWESVLVMNESRVFRNQAKAWLYTAISRASERVVICGT